MLLGAAQGMYSRCARFRSADCYGIGDLQPRVGVPDNAGGAERGATDELHIKSPLVTNDIDNVPGKKRLLFAEAAGTRYRGVAAAGFLACEC